MGASYDSIGINYADLRKPDSRIEAQIWQVLGTAQTILNVGAGTGSYEPGDKLVTAIEPSAEMIRQRAASAAPAIHGVAEDLPFDDKSFDAAMAILTVHHWTDKAKGLAEMRRVTRGPIVLLTFDPAHRGAWLNDYFPALVTLDEVQMPPISDYMAWLGPVEIRPVPVPHDCTDGFLYAYWRRPAAYLDPRIRNGMSSFHRLGDVAAGVDTLTRDLATGVWEQRYSQFLDMDVYDAGYRLVTTK